MTDFKLGDLVTATLPNGHSISNLFVVKITIELITCTYTQNNFPVTVQLLPEWLSKIENEQNDEFKSLASFIKAN